MDKCLVWTWDDRGNLVGLELFSSQEKAVEWYKLLDELLEGTYARHEYF